jgi:exosortase
MSEHPLPIPEIGHETVLVPGGSWTRIGLLACIPGSILAVLYWQILRDMALQWREDANYSHGFLVPLFCAFLVFQRRATIRAMVPRGSLLGLAVVLAGIGELLLGELAAENFLQRSSLIVIVAGLVLFHLGPEIFRAVLFPLAFLLFMVPLPAILLYAVTFPLQSLAAQQAAWILDLAGVPVLLDGNIIHLSQISLGVTEACSGIRSLISLVAGAVAWAYVALPRGWSMIVLAAAAVPITILANTARVVATGLIGQWFGIEYASGFFHTFSGWVVYVFALLCLIGVHSFIRLIGGSRGSWR